MLLPDARACRRASGSVGSHGTGIWSSSDGMGDTDTVPITVEVPSFNRDTLVGDFSYWMHQIYTDAGVATEDYWPNGYLRGLRNRRYDGVAYAKWLLGRPLPQDGVGRLQERGRPDLTMEFLVLNPRYTSLFSAKEIQTAWDRLRLPAQFGAFRR